jgi:hypothetical protein
VIEFSFSNLEREIEPDREFMDLLSYLGFRLQYDFASFSDSALYGGFTTGAGLSTYKRERISYPTRGKPLSFLAMFRPEAGIRTMLSEKFGISVSGSLLIFQPVSGMITGDMTPPVAGFPTISFGLYYYL